MLPVNRPKVDSRPANRYNFRMTGTETLLARGLAALDIPPSGDVARKLALYMSQIETWNPTYGLVNASGDDLAVKHILDCLAPWRLIQNLAAECEKECGNRGDGAAVSITDLGTGAGLPGIPLAIALPEMPVRLVDRMGKRIIFLENQKVLLGLPNVEIVESEVERAPGRLGIVTFRAFRPFTEIKLFRSIWKNLQPGGAIVAYKGKALNARLELSSLATDPVLSVPFSKARILPVWVPFLEEERCVVIVRKDRS